MPGRRNSGIYIRPAEPKAEAIFRGKPHHRLVCRYAGSIPRWCVRSGSGDSGDGARKVSPDMRSFKYVHGYIEPNKYRGDRSGRQHSHLPPPPETPSDRHERRECAALRPIEALSIRSLKNSSVQLSLFLPIKARLEFTNNSLSSNMFFTPLLYIHNEYGFKKRIGRRYR